MVQPSVITKEILNYAERFLDVDRRANLFFHLADNSLCGMFSRLDSAPGKAPEVVTFGLMQQDIVVLKYYCGRPQIETMTSGVE